MSKELTQSKFMISVGDNISLGCTRLSDENPHNHPMVFIHGSLENGRIFYSQSLKGIAPFFARNGFDAYIIDLRGKEQSTPQISSTFNFNQLDVIKDLEKVYDYIAKLNNKKQIWISHSWGGVLINCALFRFKQLNEGIDKVIHFGVKRSISVKSLKKFYQIDIGFKKIMKLESSILGYVSSRFFGVDSEAKDYHANQLQWIDPSLFVDPVDHFDYSYAAQNIKLPCTLYIVGGSDKVLGHEKDVRRFMSECNQTDSQFWSLSKSKGFSHDYGHNNMLTHQDALGEIYHPVLSWINQ